MKVRKVASGVRTLVVPGSLDIKKQAEAVKAVLMHGKLI